jgi:iron complex outermembrane receptor protein
MAIVRIPERLLYLLLALSSAAAGQSNPESLKKLSLEELSQIEVTTVSKESTAAFRTPAAIFVITQDDIRRSPARNIPDLLRVVPGVEVAQIDGDKWAIGIRGFQGKLSRSVLVLIDGRSVYTPLFKGVYWEVQDTLLEDIERIEVIRGPGGTIWGANAVDGVINIITKNAKDTRGTMVSAGGGNVEQGFLNWRYGGGNDRISYRLYGKGFTRSPEDHSDGRNFDDWRSGQTGFRIDWDTSPNDAVTIQGDAYSTVAGQKLGISTYSPPALPLVEGNGYFSGENLLGAWRHKLASGSDIQLTTYYDRTDRDDLNYREVRHTFDIDFIHHIPLARHDVIWGVGARWSPSDFQQKAETVDFLPHNQSYNIYSGFLQDEIALVPNRLSLTLGTKVEHNSSSGFEVQPSGRLSWTPTESNTLWAAVTRAVRTPSSVEDGFLFTALLQPAVPLYVRLIGDGNFKPEQLVGYELGYRKYFRGSGFVSLASFYNHYNNLLSVESVTPVVEPTPGPAHLILPLYLRNGVKADTSGVEISTLMDPAKWWRVRGSYSFLALDAKNRAVSNDASTVKQLEGDSPQHKVVIQSSFTLPRNLELELTYRFVSDLPDQKVPAYSTGDARFGWRFNRQFELSLVGQNLFQPSHFEYGGDPGPLVAIKRSAYLKLTWNR